MKIGCPECYMHFKDNIVLLVPSPNAARYNCPECDFTIGWDELLDNRPRVRSRA